MRCRAGVSKVIFCQPEKQPSPSVPSKHGSVWGPFPEQHGMGAGRRPPCLVPSAPCCVPAVAREPPVWRSQLSLPPALTYCHHCELLMWARPRPLLAALLFLSALPAGKHFVICWARMPSCPCCRAGPHLSKGGPTWSEGGAVARRTFVLSCHTVSWVPDFVAWVIFDVRRSLPLYLSLNRHDYHS